MAKTIPVVRIIEMANAFMQHSPADARQDRLSVADFVGNILHKTGNYAGFSYLTPYGAPDNDPSRVFFYTSHKLK